MIGTFDAKAWVEYEIVQMMDLYGNTRWQAARFVLDLLQEDEYDELDVIQACKAAWVARKIIG